MDLLLMPRQPVRLRPGRPRCAKRGFCGPFVNAEYYAAFPDPMWHGMGDCVECGTTRAMGEPLRASA